MREEKMTDRRHKGKMEMFAPVIIGVASGVIGSYLTVLLTLKEITVKVAYVEKEITAFEQIHPIIKRIEIELGRQSEWMKNVDNFKTNTDSRLKLLEKKANGS